MRDYPYAEVDANGGSITFKDGYTTVQWRLDETLPPIEALGKILAQRKPISPDLPFNAGAIQAVRDAIKIEERKQR